MQDGTSQYSRAQLSPGTRLNGIYEIDHLIATGGMGEVYKGHTVQTNDTVAIKVLLPELAENDAALTLFRKEASALHNLHHDAIVRYYVFTVEPVLHRPYLAMEFVEGQSLTELVRREPLTYEAVRSLVKRVAAGLHTAHERGVVHRDVSSDNIMIPGGDVARAKIIDFGIARSTLLTEQTVIGGGFAGKYNYVSPEQLGLFGGDVQAKSDIYSLGLVLVEALTGQPIDMGGSQAAILDKRRKVPDLGAVDQRIRPLLEKMLQPDPAARPETMAHVASFPLPTSRPNDERYEAEISRRHEGGSTRGGWRRVGYATAAVLVLLALGGGAAYYVLQPELPGLKEPPPPALQGTKSAPQIDARLAPPATPVQPTPSPAAPSLTPPSSATPAIPAPAAPSLTPPPSAAAPPPAVAPAQRPQPTPPSTAAPTPAIPPPAGPSLTPAPSPQAKAALPPAPSSPALVPAMPSAPAAAPPGAAPMGKSEQIMRYISQYDGGECFFAAPVAVSANSARIEGYGATVAPFEILDTAFKRDHGFEADIGVRQVTRAQCPAITFLGRLRSARAPQLNISEGTLRGGDALTGSVQGYGDANVQLLLVSDEGLVQDVSALLKPAADGKTFNMRMQRAGASGPQPQLLIAVASSRPLESLRDARSSPAEQLFSLALVEAQRTGQSIGAAARYFKLDK